ncbi:MAG: hypothetical protein ACYC0L_07990 [Thermoleophilia bacterium]
MSIAKDGDTDLDEYETLIAKYNQYAVQNINGHTYYYFPIGSSVLAVPFVISIDKSSDRIFHTDLNSYLSQNLPQDQFEHRLAMIQMFIASFYVALTAVFVYLMGELFFKSKLHSLLFALIFSFCTPAWSVASLELNQHGPSMLMLIIALYLILLSKKKPGLIQFASIPLAFSYVIRPTNSLSILLLTVFVFIQYRKYFVSYILWSLFIAVPFLIYNLKIYGSLLSPYYSPQRIGSSPTFLEALAGNLVSPGRGLFIYSPILLLSILGIFIKVRKGQLEKLDGFLISIIILHWITISSFPHWWGGSSFGPRFFTDMMPYFIYFLIPVIARLAQLQGVKKGVLAVGFLSLFLISFFIHHQGATSFAVRSWVGDPVNVDQASYRLWDWHDLSFLRR